MIEKPQRSLSTSNRIISTLRELISALDRRVPHVGRPGELRIARDAQMLRREAVAQIEALSRQGPDDKPYDQGLVNAIMTDRWLPLAREGDVHRIVRHPLKSAALAPRQRRMRGRRLPL